MKRIVNLIIIFFFVSQLAAQEKSYPASEKYPLKFSRKNVQDVEEKLNKDQKLRNLIALNNMIQKGAKSQTVQRLDSFLSEYFLGTWVPGYKLLFTWSPNQLIIKQEGFDYDDSAAQWVPSSRESYEYSPTGDPVKITSEYYNDYTSQWEGDQKTEYTWNAGKIETETIWYWDFMTSSWLKSRNGLYAYNTSGLITSIVWEYWDDASSQWYIGYMEQYSYNASSQVVQVLFSMWDDVNQQYQSFSKDEYQYHANGKVSLYSYSFFDTGISQWIPEWKSEYTYDGQGNNTKVLGSYYDQMITGWVPQEETEKTFDSNNNLISQVYSWYNDNISQWVIDMKGDYTYNNAYGFNDLLLPFLFLDPETREILNHMLTNISFFSYDESSLTWVQNEKVELFWSQNIINIEKNTVENSIRVYPNPAAGFVTFDIVGNTSYPLSFDLYDLQGRLVMQSGVTNKSTVSLSDIRSGMYLYRITDGQTVIKQDRLIINK